MPEGSEPLFEATWSFNDLGNGCYEVWVRGEGGSCSDADGVNAVNLRGEERETIFTITWLRLMTAVSSGWKRSVRPGDE